MPDKFINIFALFLLLLQGVFPAEASLPVRHIDMVPGLSNTSINCVLKDRNGFMWIGTASGLYRYDGYSVKTFRGVEGKETSVLNNGIRNVMEDAEGRLWIDADEKWRIYDPLTGEETDDISPLQKRLGIKGRISALLIDGDYDFWIGTDTDGIYHVRKGKVSHISLPAGVTGSVTDIVALPGGWVEAVTNHGTLFTVNGKTMKAGDVVPAPADDGRKSREFIHDLYIDRKNRIWVLNNERLMLYDPATKRWLNHKLPGGGYDGVVKSVFNDSHGNLWIARDHHGLERIVEEGDRIFFRHEKVDGGFTDNNTINCFAEDAQGTLWLGSYKQGLFFYNESVEKFGKEPFPDTNCIVNAGDGSVWLGTDNSGLWRWNPATGERSYVADPLEGRILPP